MSKGLGEVQWRILEAMVNWPSPEYRDKPHCLSGIKEQCWGSIDRGRLNYWDDHKQNYHFCFRRALDSLVKRGLLELSFDYLGVGEWRKRPRRMYRLTEKGLSVYCQKYTLKSKPDEDTDPG